MFGTDGVSVDDGDDGELDFLGDLYLCKVGIFETMNKSPSTKAQTIVGVDSRSTVA